MQHLLLSALFIIAIVAVVRHHKYDIGPTLSTQIPNTVSADGSEKTIFCFVFI